MKLADLVPDDTNARKHDKKNLDAVIGSLTAFGQVEPLVVQKISKKVIGGNGRLEAMKAMGWTECDVWEIDVDDSKAKILALTLNRAGELATWDDEILSDQLKSILAENIKIEDFGFSLDEIILPDAEPDFPKNENIESKPGDKWKLGEHVLWCGENEIDQCDKIINGWQRASKKDAILLERRENI